MFAVFFCDITQKEEKSYKNGEKHIKIRYKNEEIFLCVHAMILSKKREKCRIRFGYRGEKMNYDLTAEQVLECLIEIIETDLAELLEAKSKNNFIVGEWYAYIECLEITSHWKNALRCGLDYNPEIKFKI